MSTKLLMTPPGSDTSSDVARAASHLVDYRDGLFAHLMWLAQATAELAADEQTYILERLFAVLGPAEARRRAAQISTLATPCWGAFREVGDQRLRSVELLRAVCRDTATAVRDEFHRESCICREAGR